MHLNDIPGLLQLISTLVWAIISISNQGNNRSQSKKPAYEHQCLDWNKTSAGISICQSFEDLHEVKRS